LRLHIAPIRGITDCIFRTIFVDHFRGFDGAVAPFISTVKGKTVNRSYIRDVLPENNRNLQVVPQILGNNAGDFVMLSKKLFELGYHNVNWNIGCPFPQVTKKKRGAGLLPYPDTIKAFLDQVLPRIPNKLSIKTRLGLVSREEMRKWLPVLNGFPLAEIIMHPRTGRQLYSGDVDLEGFKEFVNDSVHQVVYNGDITSRETFLALQSKFPKIDQWMIGRGAIANPFLAEILKGDTTSEAAPYARIKAFHDDLLEAYSGVFDNSGNVIDKMKGIWLYVCQNFPDGKAILKRIQKTKRLDQYKEFIRTVLSG
jgi:tRNA-dihydrouridine synthase B